jgi:hypothetical protein
MRLPDGGIAVRAAGRIGNAYHHRKRWDIGKADHAGLNLKSPSKRRNADRDFNPP